MTPIPDLIPLHTGRPGLRTMLQVIVSASADQRDQVPSSLPSLPSVKPPSDPTGAQISSPSSPLSPVKSGPDLIRDNSCNSCQPGSDPIRDNSCNSCLDFISSDSTLDRYGEIITPAGWDLTNYRRNPVFQNAHQYGDIIFTLGKALVTEIRGGNLFQRIEFATGANPLAKIAHALYAGKFLNAVSVGFIPRRWKDAPAAEHAGEEAPPRNTQHASRIYLEQELLEVSAVSIPANPNALALAVKSGAVEKSDLKNTADLINYTLASGHAPASVHQLSTINYQPLLALARQIRAQLKHV